MQTHKRWLTLISLVIAIGLAAPVLATTWYLDVDRDGWGLCSESVEADTQPPLHVEICGDCNDDDDSMYPGAPEVPDDGVDQDCNDVDATLCYTDADGDGYGDPVSAQIIALDGDCFGPGESYDSTDCDDDDETIHPGAVEIPNDGIDQDCDGEDLFDPVPLQGTPWSLIKARYR